MLSARNKDEQLKNWFADIATKIKDLDYEDFTLAGRKIQELIRALEEVEQFHQVNECCDISWLPSSLSLHYTVSGRVCRVGGIFPLHVVWSFPPLGHTFLRARVCVCVRMRVRMRVRV